MLNHTKLPSGEEVWKNNLGEIHLQTPAPHLYHYRLVGLINDPFIDVVQRELGPPGQLPIIFADTTEMEGYSARFLDAAADHARRRAHENHMLVGSRLAALGVAFHNLSTGARMRVYRHREEFEEAVRRALLVAPRV